MARGIVKHTIDYGGNPFQIWNENGKVRQNGRFHLPQYLARFSDTKRGREQAGAYIAGMLMMQRIMKGEEIR